MKFVYILVSLFIAGSSATADGKISIAEMKKQLATGEGLPLGYNINVRQLSDTATCDEIRQFLKDNNVVANGSDGKPTDVANVVNCVE